VAQHGHLRRPGDHEPRPADGGRSAGQEPRGQERPRALPQGPQERRAGGRQSCRQLPELVWARGRHRAQAHVRHGASWVGVQPGEAAVRVAGCWRGRVGGVLWEEEVVGAEREAVRGPRPGGRGGARERSAPERAPPPPEKKGIAAARWSSRSGAHPTPRKARSGSNAGCGLLALLLGEEEGRG
jgi:hypothetical protein